MDAVLLDTDVFSYLARGHDTRGDAYRPYVKGNTVAISFIKVGEIYFGAEKRKWTGKTLGTFLERLKAVVHFNQEFTVLVFAQMLDCADDHARAKKKPLFGWRHLRTFPMEAGPIRLLPIPLHEQYGALLSLTIIGFGERYNPALSLTDAAGLRFVCRWNYPTQAKTRLEWATHRECVRRVIPTAALNSADGGQRRVSPFVRDDTVAEIRIGGQWSALQDPDKSFDGMQGRFVRRVAGQSWRR